MIKTIKNIENIKYLINFILHSLIYYIAAIFFMYYSSNNRINYYIPLIITLSIAINFLCRKYCTKLMYFILVSILILIIPFLTKSTRHEIGILLIANITIIISLYIFWNNKTTKEIMSTPSILFISFFILTTLFCNKIYLLSTILGSIYIFLYFIAKYLSNLISYLYFNINYTNCDFNKIILSNNIIFALYLTIGLILIPIIKLLNLDKLFIFLLQPVIKIIQKILQSSLGNLINLFVTEKVKIDAPIQETTSINIESSSTNNPIISAIIYFLSRLIKIACIIAISFIIIYLIKQIYTFIKSRKNITSNNVDNIEYIKPKTIKNKILNVLKIEKNTSKSKIIRKIYFKRISKLKKTVNTINSTLTHNEIANEVNTHTNVNIDELTKIYEKARYSNIPCTKKDIQDTNK